MTPKEHTARYFFHFTHIDNLLAVSIEDRKTGKVIKRWLYLPSKRTSISWTRLDSWIPKKGSALPAQKETGKIIEAYRNTMKNASGRKSKKAS